ncbi:MAG: PspA/IM30 family protein [Proteobacteria bacterium]|nr:PspA/IM30 family protein [Pseudomonadota bacterium]
MGIFGRISTLFKAEANAAIDKMEDPEKVLNQTIRDMTEQLNQAKAKIAENIAYEKRLKIQYDKAVERAKEWENKAMMAVNGNRDDLAAEALGRQAEAQKEADAFRAQWQTQKQGCDKLKEQLKNMNNKIEEAKRKKALLVAQAKRAEASKTIHETLAGMNDASAFSTFDRMAEKVEALEAQAQASEELATEYSGGDDLEKEINSLKPAVNNNDALAALKAKMGKTSAAPAPAAGEGSYDSQYNNAAANKLQNIQSWDDL